MEDDILEKYKKIRKTTEQICKSLNIEDYVPQPQPFVSPIKWHLSHTTWFFETMILKLFLKDYQPFNPDYDFIFNSYYETIGTHITRGNRGDLSRPTVRETYAYRKHVDENMAVFLKKGAAKEIEKIIVLGMHHEQQHQELIRTDIKFTFSVNPIQPKFNKNTLVETENTDNKTWIKIPEGIYEVGFTGKGFCYDNELNPHKIYLQNFEISSHLVTNQEYIEFIEDGGYKKPRLWHANAWEWINKNKIELPLYWKKQGNQYFNFTLAGVREVLPEIQVAHINYYEAYAFAQWKKMRLPTEFEWEVAQNKFKWGTRWEWTESSYLPYPGFKTLDDASGEYNGKFMVGQKVLRGASVATAIDHSRPTYRNYFYPHENWQFTGIRLAK